MDVTLEKGDDGLGITVAGYVSPDSTNNGKAFVVVFFSPSFVSFWEEDFCMNSRVKKSFYDVYKYKLIIFLYEPIKTAKYQHFC